MRFVTSRDLEINRPGTPNSRSGSSFFRCLFDRREFDGKEDWASRLNVAILPTRCIGVLPKFFFFFFLILNALLF